MNTTIEKTDGVATWLELYVHGLAPDYMNNWGAVISSLPSFLYVNYQCWASERMLDIATAEKFIQILLTHKNPGRNTDEACESSGPTQCWACCRELHQAEYEYIEAKYKA